MSKEKKTVCKNCGSASLDNGTQTKPCCPDPDHRGRRYYLSEFEKWKKGFHINDIWYSEEFARAVPYLPGKRHLDLCEKVINIARDQYANFLFETFY